MVGLLGMHIVNRLRKLVVFEDFNWTYTHSYGANFVVTYGKQSGIRPTRLPSACVTKRLTAASLDLQHLSAAFMADARHFWDAVQSDWMWTSLLTLALTSQDLIPREGSKDISAMLCRGAEVVEKMPQLQIMEIWNSSQGNAAVFRYKSSRPGVAPQIEWRSNWRFTLERSVVAAWQSVSTDLRDTEAQYEFISSTLVQKHGEAVAALGLQLEVACPVSVEEIRKEHEEMGSPQD
ncbi:hypothetical protein B5807_10382 [Epicoccum nigrum]|jgi:hypothetical protein|uniref:DUF6546 domain-containing protein n=1 Tax=Epicoccum nigrum TaxID=105696 RepID=A0A1Y2LRF4_EPING|nr:hypothetical protein B5807_10382 [Epicoccum nigrum]